MLVVVASLNPVKIKAVQTGFAKVFPDQEIEYQSVSVPSKVSAQPMTSHETLTGAINRVEAAKLAQSQADYWVGLEGGAENVDTIMQTFAWIVVSDGKHQGQSRTASFTLPPEVAKLVNTNSELGTVMDKLYNQHNSKQKQGAVGILSQGLITRTNLYSPAVVLALTEVLR